MWNNSSFLKQYLRNEKACSMGLWGYLTGNKYSNNACMRTLTRNQCTLPVFEEILPRLHNKLVQDLIFMLCMWHALAKLWLHTLTTLWHLKMTTRELGKTLWRFAKMSCTDFATMDLPREQAAWARHQAAKESTKKMGGALKKKVSSSTTHRFFNLLTYKLHALGDYFWAILMYGSMDNYSTRVVCQALFDSFLKNLTNLI